MVHAPAPLVANPVPGSVLAALLDFEQKPGRYPVARREPAVLFDRVGTVLRLASDRAVDGPAPGGAVSTQRARQAARFFVRTVMLRPGADHHTLLGLTPGSAPELQRDHYRMMIRLAHPDFASADGAWPADAASRINIANDVLSSRLLRQRYDATLAPEPTARAPIQALPAPRGTPRERGGEGRLSRLLNRRGTHAMITVLLLAGAGWLFSGADHPAASLTVLRPGSVMAEPGVPPPKAPPPAAAWAPTAIQTPQGMALWQVFPPPVPAPDAGTAGIDLDRVQPVMDQVLGALRSGRGETVRPVMGPEWRNLPSTQHFVDQFNQWLAGRAVRGLDVVKSTSSIAEGRFVVDSTIDLQLLDALQQQETARLNLRAFFLPPAGAPVLTQLVVKP